MDAPRCEGDFDTESDSEVSARDDDMKSSCDC